MGIVHGDAEVKHHIHTSPVAQSDGYTIGILLVEVLDVILVFLHVGTQFLLVGLVHIWYGVESCLHVVRQCQFEGIPDLLFEVVEILLILCGSVELQVCCHVA